MSWRRPPAFMPGMPSCQPLMRLPSGNVIDWPRLQEESNSSSVSKSTPEIVHLHGVAGLGLGAGSFFDIDDHKFGRGVALVELDFGLRLVSHGLSQSWR